MKTYLCSQLSCSGIDKENEHLQTTEYCGEMYNNMAYVLNDGPKRLELGVGEIAKQLGTLAAFSEELHLIASTHMATHSPL